MGEKGITPLQETLREHISIKNSYISTAIAEFLGTFIFTAFAVGAGCHAALLGENLFIGLLGTILGLMVGIYVVGGISGGHLNPAVTLACAITGSLSWIKVPIYWIAQFFGAYLGSGLSYLLYLHALKMKFCNDDIANCPGLAGVFAPLANPDVGVSFADQVLGTALFVMLILAICDRRNMNVPPHLCGLLVGLALFAVNCSFGYFAGGVLNPARDIGARLMAVTVGFSAEVGVFTAGDDHHYWIAPMFGPLVGGCVAAVIYNFLIAAHLLEKKQEIDQSLFVPNRFNLRAHLDDPNITQPYFPQQQSGKPYRSGQ